MISGAFYMWGAPVSPSYPRSELKDAAVDVSSRMRVGSELGSGVEEAVPYCLANFWSRPSDMVSAT